MSKNKLKQQSGFTLIEILVVIGIIAILATIVLIAINPGRQFAQARDTQRVSNVNAILNAIGQRMADNKGVFEGTFAISGTTYTCGPLPTTPTAVTSIMAANATTPTGSLGCLIPTYITVMPVEPKDPTTDPYMVDLTGGRVTVAAPATEIASPDISVTR